MTDWHHDAARGLVRRPSQSTPSSPVLRPVRAPSPAPAHRPASSGARSPSPAGSRRISWASNNAGGGLLTGTVSLNDSFGLPTRPARPVSGRASSPGPRLGVPGGTGGGGGRGLVHARMASAPQISAGFEGGWGGEGWSGASALAPLSRDWGEVERYVADLERQNAALRAQLDQAVKEGYVWHVAYSHSVSRNLGSLATSANVTDPPSSPRPRPPRMHVCLKCSSRDRGSPLPPTHPYVTIPHTHVPVKTRINELICPSHHIS